MASLHLTTTDDLAHPGLEPYRTLRRRKDLERQALFVAEGDKVVQRLLESPFPIESLLVTPDWLERLRPLLDPRDDPVTVFLAQEKADIERVTGFSSYQGVKAVGRIPRRPTLAEVLQAAPAPRLIAALEGISNAENLGVIVRNAAAMGVQAIVVGETSCSPFLTRAIRTSMGAIFRLPAVEDVPLIEALGLLRHAHVRCYAAHPAAGGLTLSQADLTGDCCLVFGSEGYGLTEPILQACDAAVAVPMARGVDSLNVSSAAGVFFYEAWRQRGFRATAHPPAPGRAADALA